MGAFFTCLVLIGMAVMNDESKANEAKAKEAEAQEQTTPRRRRRRPQQC